MFESGVGVRRIFWYGLGINRDYNLFSELTNCMYIIADIHDIRHFGSIVAPQHNFILQALAIWQIETFQ
jgi:hypothetical protein